jgi:hypothetical protein
MFLTNLQSIGNAVSGAYETISPQPAPPAELTYQYVRLFGAQQVPVLLAILPLGFESDIGRDAIDDLLNDIPLANLDEAEQAAYARSPLNGAAVYSTELAESMRVVGPSLLHAVAELDPATRVMLAVENGGPDLNPIFGFNETPEWDEPCGCCSGGFGGNLLCVADYVREGVQSGGLQSEDGAPLLSPEAESVLRQRVASGTDPFRVMFGDEAADIENTLRQAIADDDGPIEDGEDGLSAYFTAASQRIGYMFLLVENTSDITLTDVRVDFESSNIPCSLGDPVDRDDVWSEFSLEPRARQRVASECVSAGAPEFRHPSYRRRTSALDDYLNWSLNRAHEHLPCYATMSVEELDALPQPAEQSITEPSMSPGARRLFAVAIYRTDAIGDPWESDYLCGYDRPSRISYAIDGLPERRNLEVRAPLRDGGARIWLPAGWYAQ